MNRNYISPENSYDDIYGTFNSYSDSSFFNAAYINYPAEINIINSDIIYYENSFNEQLSLVDENIQKIFNTSDNKLKFSAIGLNNLQSNYSRSTNSEWNIRIQYRDLLSEHIFYLLKKNRTFEGLQNKMTLFGNVDRYIKNFIDNNIKDLYKYVSVDLYIDYLDLKSNGVYSYSPVYNPNITNKLIKLTTNVSPDDILISFKQEKPGSEYTFYYYYDIKFNLK